MCLSDLWRSFQGSYHTVNGSLSVSQKIGLYSITVWSQWQQLDVICEQLLLLSYLTGKTVMSCGIQPVSCSQVSCEIHHCDRPNQWEMANFDLLQNRNPWAECHKIRPNWLRPREDPMNQIWCKSIHIGASGKWVTYNVFVPYLCIYIYPFSKTRLQVRPVDGFSRAIAQNTWNHARMCLVGVVRLKFNTKPVFIPQNRQNLAQNWTFQVFSWNV